MEIPSRLCGDAGRILDYACLPLPRHLRTSCELPTQWSGKRPLSRGTSFPQLGQTSRVTVFTRWTGNIFTCADRSSAVLRLIWQVVHQNAGVTAGERYWGLADRASNPLMDANRRCGRILTWMKHRDSKTRTSRPISQSVSAMEHFGPVAASSSFDPSIGHG